jgi:hypothetical protein
MAGLSSAMQPKKGAGMHINSQPGQQAVNTKYPSHVGKSQVAGSSAPASHTRNAGDQARSKTGGKASTGPARGLPGPNTMHK